MSWAARWNSQNLSQIIQVHEQMGHPVRLITKTNEAKLTIESISGPVRTVDPGILDSTATATSGPLANNASRNIASASS